MTYLARPEDHPVGQRFRKLRGRPGIMRLPGALIRLCDGLLVERFGPDPTVRTSVLIAFASLSNAIAGTSVPVILLGFALTGVGYGVVMPLVFSRAARDHTMTPGSVIAAVGCDGMLLGGVVAERRLAA